MGRSSPQTPLASLHQDPVIDHSLSRACKLRYEDFLRCPLRTVRGAGSSAHSCDPPAARSDGSSREERPTGWAAGGAACRTAARTAAAAPALRRGCGRAVGDAGAGPCGRWQRAGGAGGICGNQQRHASDRPGTRRPLSPPGRPAAAAQAAREVGGSGELGWLQTANPLRSCC